MRCWEQRCPAEYEAGERFSDETRGGENRNLRMDQEVEDGIEGEEKEFFFCLNNRRSPNPNAAFR